MAGQNTMQSTTRNTMQNAEQNAEQNAAQNTGDQVKACTALFLSDPAADREREMLFAFQKNHPELEPYGYYINGWSDGKAREEERAVYIEGNMVYDSQVYSAFPRLMVDVKKGKVRCIVVNNLGSFALGYLETIYYIQNLFQYLNVRFITLEDDFDSAREADMRRIASKADHLARVEHSRKLSRVRCEQARKKAMQPDAMPPGSAPYGYLPGDPTSEDKNYRVDPQTAPYVTMIFRWSLMGYSCGEIADRMMLLGEPTPGQLRIGQTADPSKWNSHAVLKILQNPNYTGDMHIGRMQQALYKSETRRRTDSREWIVRENTHEPLTTRQDYEEVQRGLARKNKRG